MDLLGGKDFEETVIDDATDLDTAIALINDLKEKYNNAAEAYNQVLLKGRQRGEI